MTASGKIIPWSEDEEQENTGCNHEKAIFKYFLQIIFKSFIKDPSVLMKKQLS